MADGELVSVIIPAYNSATFITDTLSSVKEQTYTNLEMIVVDDFSKDNTCQIVDQFAQYDNRIRLISHLQNMGPAISRNDGIKACKGRYIAFLDSDDLWLPEKLEKQISFMNANSCALSYSSYTKINPKGEFISKPVCVPRVLDYNRLLMSNFIACLTAVYDTEITGKLYMPNIKKRQDYCLWLKILKMGYEAYGLNECLALYRIRSNSVSHNKLRAASYQWKVYREVEKLPLSKSLSCFVRYAYYGYMKHRQ